MTESGRSPAFAPSEQPPLPSLCVDEVGLESRAAELGRRSLKRETKRQGLERAISMVDLTTLEGADSSGRVKSLCRRALRPAPEEGLPPVAAVCVYPNLVATARSELCGSPVAVASVSSGFPAGQVPLPLKVEDTKFAVEEGADEIDIVISRGACLRGDWIRVHDEVATLKDTAGRALLKVILETGELGTFDRVARAAWVACTAGADFIKTSTGKVSVNATPATALCMMHVLEDYRRESGRSIGLKVAGGIRSSKQALHYLVLLGETLGPEWMTNGLFRIGASSLLNDLVRQWKKQTHGRYAGADDVTID